MNIKTNLMAIELNGDFIKIQKTTIRISEIISIKPVSIVQFDFQGNVIGRDFPKITLRTNHDYYEFLYNTGEDRDKNLSDLQEKISSYQATSKNDNERKTTINISSSSGVNVVSNSENVTIQQDAKQAASEIIKQMQEELAKSVDITQEIREDIFAALTDFQEHLDKKKEIKRYTFKTLFGMTSDVASLSSLAISLGQMLGYLPR